MVLLTDGENPVELEDWEAAADKMNSLNIKLAVMYVFFVFVICSILIAYSGVDFDDEYYGFNEEDKSNIKVIIIISLKSQTPLKRSAQQGNEEFYAAFVERLHDGLGVVGNCDSAIEEVSRPDVKQTKSALMGNVLRLGDVDEHPEDAIEIIIKTSKCTAYARPKSFKKFARFSNDDEDIIMRDADDDHDKLKATYGQLSMQTRYMYDPTGPHDDEDEELTDEEPEKKANLVEVEKEDLIRGFKYGSSYVPAPEDNFPKLETRKGIDICGFFSGENFKHELAIGEVQYVWADPASPLQQVALSSIIKAMASYKNSVAIARWVNRDGAEPKMGILQPMTDESVDYFLWVQVRLFNSFRTGRIQYSRRCLSQTTYASTPLLPWTNSSTKRAKWSQAIRTNPRMNRWMPWQTLWTQWISWKLVKKTKKGTWERSRLFSPLTVHRDRKPWYETALSYNPAIHRVKQALFHGAIVEDLNRQPLPPPHPELLKYFNPPRKVVKRARRAIEAAKEAFNVKEGEWHMMFTVIIYLPAQPSTL